jgi:SPP1 family predicted phage head-tail adaptor
MTSGELRHRVAFEERESQAADQYGRVQAAFVERFWAAAAIIPRFGGEAVLGARLQGTQPLTIKLRYSKEAARITPEWRARNARSGEIYNIRSVVDPDQRREWLEILCEAGRDNG